MNATVFTPGNRVVWSGPSVNAQWPIDTKGTVTRVRASGLIDVRWDHGATNYGCDPVGFSRARRS